MVKKQTWWIALIILCLSWGAMNCLGVDTGRDANLVALLQQEVENREANLEHLKVQHDAGRTGIAQVLEAEQELLRVRQELARAKQTLPTNPLRQPIPQFEVEPMKLGEFAETLRHVLDDHVNFVLKEGARELVVPALDMKGTDLLTVLNILREVVPDLGIKVSVGTEFVPIQEAPAATHGPGASMMMDMGGMGMEGLGDMMGGFGMAPPPAVEWPDLPTVIFERTHVALAAPAPRETLTLYLGELLQSMDFDDVLTSIESAWEASRAPGAPRSAGEATLRFHEDTELLIAAGARPQLQVVQDVYLQLKNMQADLKSRTRTSLQEEYKEEREKLQAQVASQKKAMEEKVAAARERVESAYDEAKVEYRKKLDDAASRWNQDRDRLAAEVAQAKEGLLGEVQRSAEMRVELAAMKERLEEERARLIEKFEEKLEQTREQAYYERRELLEEVDRLKRALAPRQLRRTLDPESAAAEDGS